LSALGVFVFHHRYQYLDLGVVLIVAAGFLVPKISDYINQLGNEERILTGVRIPGSGMLANKPRDTSRLTRWTQHRLHPGFTYEELAENCFCCNCGEPYRLGDLKWTANVLECEEEIDDVPAVSVDPEGGRYVLICPCGIGHYLLREKHPK
jgi:hypothetical protein